MFGVKFDEIKLRGNLSRQVTKSTLWSGKLNVIRKFWEWKEWNVEVFFLWK